MRVSYCEGYYVPLPEGHAFPMGKFPAFHRILLAEGLLRTEDVVEPDVATWEQLRWVHSADYLKKLREGLLDRKEERKMGLPWSEALVKRSRTAVGGTLLAMRMALEDGLAANLAGGTHHAFPDHGEGFCVLNDVGVALRVLLAEGRLKRALVVDLDVHQGNGTAAIFEHDPAVTTFSMHGERNYPWNKERSTLDVGLEDGTTDEQYLCILDEHLPGTIDRAAPDLIVYLAGVDVLAGDRFGRLALTCRGLQARDRYLLESVRQHGTPLVLLMSGGYAKSPEETADLHATVHREARVVFG